MNLLNSHFGFNGFLDDQKEHEMAWGDGTVKSGGN